MTGRRYWMMFLLIAFLLTACQSAVTDVADAVIEREHEGDLVTLTVIYTNDEHGWIMGEEVGQGAAEIAGLWAANYAGDDAVLILSGGDNWTGPAISTWFGGESMVEVMNAMGYTAAAVGNHEFDFGLAGLKIRTEQANYPYLGANIRYKSDGSVPAVLGFQPYKIV